jgi:hypothetical protein
MSNDAPDPMLDRAIDELRRLPPVDPVAIQRIVAAAAEARVTPADEPVFAGRPAGRSVRIWSAIGLAAAAAVAGFIVRGVFTTKAPADTIAVLPVPAIPSESLRPVTSVRGESSPILQQFVFENAKARRVSVVGDFNKWDPSTSPMRRSSEDGTWSVMIPITPGRHVYGFMVDDSLFTLDPRAPKVKDVDFGTDASVVIAGRP